MEPRIEKPVKISSRLTIVIADGLANVCSAQEIAIEEVIEEVKNWLRLHGAHPRYEDVREWFEGFEAQNPLVPPTEPMSEQKSKELLRAIRIIPVGP